MMFLAAAVLASTLSIENYATMPTLASPRFSPDGKRVAYVLTHADLVKSAYDSDVWVIDTDSTYDTEVEHGTHPRWSPDGKTVACLYENAIWAEGKKVTEEPGPIHDFEYSPDGGSIAFIETDAAKKSEREDFHVVGVEVRQAHLYVMDLGTRAVRRLTQGDFSINSMSWTPDGKTLVVERLPRVDLDSLYHTDLYTLDVASATMTPLVVRPGADRAPKVSPDGRRVAFISMGGVHDWLREQRLWVIDLQTHTMQVASREYDGSPESIHWLDANTLAFDGAVGTTTQIFYAAAAGRATQKTHFAGVAADIDVNAGRIAYIYQSLSQPPEVYVDDKQLTHHNDAFREKRRPETRVIHWKNPKDGWEIEGLLTLPPNYERGKRVPLLTFVHGGPASRHDQSFLGYLASLYVPDVLAEQGFAVLRPNPRGTGGYGEKFRQGNRNGWVDGPWRDINAGIDKLIADGVADPSRLGLMGWSYGGFIASWATGHSDRLKAISIGAPVTDLLSFHGTTDIRDFIPSYFPGLDLETLRAQSPMWHLKKTRAHVLIEQGESDERVPITQGTMLYRRLQELGVDVEMITYPRSHHVPSEPMQRIDVATRNVKFFVKWVLPLQEQHDGHR
ncbi:MAG TPA: S9 family peptidase [Thermoanaerobaculia bacterium]|jgi:dipeptidyl aminopeptidase/acylaminoacyl peptidase